MKKYHNTETIKVPRFSEANGYYTTSKRSAIMAKIKGKDSKPEVLLRRALWRAGVRFRVNVKSITGKPDIAIKKYKVAIFVDGEFWHGYDWEEKRKKIKSNKAFWLAKIERNMQRDREVNATLEEEGFRVFRFWQKEVQQNLGQCLNKILSYLEQQEMGRGMRKGIYQTMSKSQQKQS